MKTIKRCQCGETYTAWGPFEGGDPGMCPRCWVKLLAVWTPPDNWPPHYRDLREET